ncbi:MAG: phosphate signaling complex protein PhoU [Candidatus Hydrogenedens sp.]|jgi:phosphate transport system protein|nr:phosphate signaling complex protein PhoU [Candidatus Hydrogenedens sp.]
MTRHFQNEIEKLKVRILALGSLVEKAVEKAVIALENRDTETAQVVVGEDKEIDLLEVDIEEECQKILALHQPVAHDLRFIIAVLKINSELERIGDAAVSIAEQICYWVNEGHTDVSYDFESMAKTAKDMLHNSLDAFVNFNALTAFEVIAEDDKVDAIYGDVHRFVRRGVQSAPHQSGGYIHLLSISRHIERIADHASNIAEIVIYLVEGRIIRHRSKDAVKQDIFGNETS